MLKNPIKMGTQYITFWIFLSFTIVNILKNSIDFTIYKSVTVLMITNALISIFIVRYYNNNIHNNDKLIIYINEILFHWIPLLYIVLIVKIPNIPFNIFMFIIPFLLVLLHSRNYDYNQTHYYTKWNNGKCLIIGTVVYLLILLII